MSWQTNDVAPTNVLLQQRRYDTQLNVSNNPFMQSVVMLIAVMLSVVAPQQRVLSSVNVPNFLFVNGTTER